MSRLIILLKICMTVVVVGGCVIASLYAGYILLILLIIAVVAVVSGIWFNYKERKDRFNFDDY